MPQVFIKEITPLNFQCIVAACPAVFSMNDVSLIIIGKTLTSEEVSALLGNKVGSDETAIVVPKGMITELLEN